MFLSLQDERASFSVNSDIGDVETCYFGCLYMIFSLPYFSVLTQKSIKRSQERPNALPLDARGYLAFVSHRNNLEGCCRVVCSAVFC